LNEEERKVGSKGQVVIPRAMRKALKIEPGSKILFRLEDNALILRKPNFDALAVFRKTAQQINYNKKIDPHQYTEEFEPRRKPNSMFGSNPKLNSFSEKDKTEDHQI
jgi:AbrB family looped-hinge helix DNA binding protein